MRCASLATAAAPPALDRLTYDPGTEHSTYRSDKADGPTAGTQALDSLEFLARLLTHISDPGQVMTRYYSVLPPPLTRPGARSSIHIWRWIWS